MYPDVLDVQQAMPKLPGSPKPEEIWPDVVFVLSFLDNARGRCYNDGRHRFTSAVELKKTAENFIGHSLSDWGFAVAVKLFDLKTRPHVINPAELGKLGIKFPPLDQFEEARPLWIDHMRGLEQEIADEREQMKRFSH